MKRPRALDYANPPNTSPSKSADDDSAALVIATCAMGLLSCFFAAVFWIRNVELSLPTLVIITAVPAGSIIVGRQGHWLGTKHILAIIGIAINSLALVASIPLFLGALLRSIFHP